MGLRCSLLGHDFGETTTERDREEQGGEVVVVERELQVCDRCGSEKVLSENTEVRTLESDPEEDVSEPGAPERASETEQTSFSEPSDASVSQSGTASSTGGTPPEHAPSADDDDAVILEDDPDQPRDRGQWPDDAQQEAMAETADTGEPEPEPAPWPDQEGEDEGFDAKPTSDDGDGDVDFGGGLTPESADTAEAGDEGYVEAPSESPADATPPDEIGGAFTDSDATAGDSGPGGSGEPAGPSGQAADSGQPSGPRQASGGPGQSSGGAGSTTQSPSEEDVPDAGFTSAGPVNPPEGRTDDSDSLLVCPECGFERQAARASLRAGDICPECRKGYLAERR